MQDSDSEYCGRRGTTSEMPNATTISASEKRIQALEESWDATTRKRWE